jgi:hypothetical protein
MESGNLDFLEPSGPLQACNGAALPFYLLRQFMRRQQNEDETNCIKSFANKNINDDVFFYHSGMYESFPFAILTSRSTSYSE